MNGGPDVLGDLRAAVEPHGLFLRGIVPFGVDGPLLGDGRRARTVVLLGNIGGSMWPAFQRWHRDHPGIADPLDAWSKAIIRPVAEMAGAVPFFPSDPPWQPFQQWAMRAEGLKASPLGILIHPRYGLWHGYRGALGFPGQLAVDPAETCDVTSPCALCREKPCLSACPAGAITAEGFGLAACRNHLGLPAGGTGCMRRGCLAREACPVGAAYRYPPEQLRFHMAALSI